MAESNKKKILARIFCLKQDTAHDDDQRFKEFWGKVKHCEICTNDPSKNFSKDTLEKELNYLKKYFLKKEFECLVVAVSSHGIEQQDNKDHTLITFEIRWARWESFPVNELFKIFDDGDIRNKNKIFLMQMCRDRSNKETVTRRGLDQGVYCKSEPNLVNLDGEDSSMSKSQSTQQLGDKPWPKTWKLAQPCIVNSIVFFSAPSGYISHTKKYVQHGGGWLFLCMRNLLESVEFKSLQTISIIQLFLMVNNEMSKMVTSDETSVGMSSFNHMLTDNISIEFMKSGR